MNAFNFAIKLFPAFALCWSVATTAETLVPPLVGRVTDQTATLSAEQKATLEQTMQSFEARKGSQLAVLIVPTVVPEAIEQYAMRVAELWKLGRKNVDDGAILVIARDDRALRIEVGSGLEGAVNDATSKRIISEIITPRFKQGDFFGGITAGVDQLIRVIDGETLPKPSATTAGSINDLPEYVPAIFLLAMVVGGVLRSLLGRLPGALVTGGAVALLAWMLAGTVFIAAGAGVMALLFTLVSGGMGGMVGAGIGGHPGAYGRGGLGRGFGGGGGGFSGGGASGRW